MGCPPRRFLWADSGGAGRQRGGLGQVMEIGSREDAAFGIFARFERVKYPARGRHGGGDGQAGRLSLKSGTELKPKGLSVVPPGAAGVIKRIGRLFRLGWSYRCTTPLFGARPRGYKSRERHSTLRKAIRSFFY